MKKLIILAFVTIALIGFSFFIKHPQGAKASGFDPSQISGLDLWLKADQGLYQDSGKHHPRVPVREEGSHTEAQLGDRQDTGPGIGRRGVARGSARARSRASGG